MSKITITRNCANGEHVFIVAQSYVEGRETMHTAFVCQHCLYYVSSSEWDAHINNNFKKEIFPESIIKQEIDQKRLDPLIEHFMHERKPETLNIDEEPNKLPYPGKKRGPKPKGKINGL